MKYLKHVVNQREGQRLYTELGFETINHTTVKVKVKILYVRLNFTQLSLIYSTGPTFSSHNFKYPIYHP